MRESFFAIGRRKEEEKRWLVGDGVGQADITPRNASVSGVAHMASNATVDWHCTHGQQRRIRVAFLGRPATLRFMAFQKGSKRENVSERVCSVITLRHVGQNSEKTLVVAWVSGTVKDETAQPRASRERSWHYTAPPMVCGQSYSNGSM